MVLLTSSITLIIVLFKHRRCKCLAIATASICLYAPILLSGTLDPAFGLHSYLYLLTIIFLLLQILLALVGKCDVQSLKKLENTQSHADLIFRCAFYNLPSVSSFFL